MTGFTATIETPAVGSAVFYDRTYTFDSLGSFTGHSFIKMSNEDKHIRHSHVQMKLRLPHPMILYVAQLDNSELPWLESEGWTLTNLHGVSYHGVRQTRHTDWSGELNEDHYGPGRVWQKTFTAGAVEMRGNNGGMGSYVIFAAHPSNPPAPVAATECPAGWEQVGEPGADIGGCGLQQCGERYWSNNPSECADACAARSDCRGFNWAPMGGDRNHEAMTVCTLYNSDAPTSSWWGSAGHVQIFCKPETEWTVVQGAATSPHSGVNLGADAFNAMFAACPVVRYTNPSMTGSPAVYKRHTNDYTGDAHALFTYLWAQADNAFHTQFDIYPSLADARAGTNPWQFCNFADQPQPNHFTVGFPRDCGPAVYQPHIWFHATRTSGLQTQGFFEIYTGSNCPVAEPTYCQNGILSEHNGVCCAAECGSCGGSGCGP